LGIVSFRLILRGGIYMRGGLIEGGSYMPVNTVCPYGAELAFDMVLKTGAQLQRLLKRGPHPWPQTHRASIWVPYNCSIRPGLISFSEYFDLIGRGLIAKSWSSNFVRPLISHFISQHSYF
jgi:hypothetical protein